MSSLLGNFSVATTTNNVFTGTALNDILLTAQSNQKIWIGGASGASNVLSVGSNVTTTSNLEVTGLTSLSNLVVTGTVVGFNGVSSNQSFSNVYSSNIYGSNAAFSNLTVNGAINAAGQTITASTFAGNASTATTLNTTTIYSQSSTAGQSGCAFVIPGPSSGTTFGGFISSLYGWGSTLTFIFTRGQAISSIPQGGLSTQYVANGSLSYDGTNFYATGINLPTTGGFSIYLSYVPATPASLWANNATNATLLTTRTNSTSYSTGGTFTMTTPGPTGGHVYAVQIHFQWGSTGCILVNGVATSISIGNANTTYTQSINYDGTNVVAVARNLPSGGWYLSVVYTVLA
jgi:hypothetical protein